MFLNRTQNGLMQKVAVLGAMSLMTFAVVPVSAHADGCDDPGMSVTTDDGGYMDDGCGGGGAMDNSGEDSGSDPGSAPSNPDNLGDTIVGPNWNNPGAYTTIGFDEVPDGAHSLDAKGMPYSSDQARAIDQAVDDAIHDGGFGHYTVGTWVPYPGDDAYDGFHNWFSDVLGWYASCISYNGAKATGGLAIPDGALCLSGWN